MGIFFGTDGVRGIANIELTPELSFDLGKAGAYILTKEKLHAPQVLIARDTRVSGEMLEAALTAGMCSVGAAVISAGVIPTPAVAYLIRKYGFDAGVMISASHNPFEDNGIKFFNSGGYKLPDALEDEIEDIIIHKRWEELPRPRGEKVGSVRKAETALEDYIDFLAKCVDNSNLSGLKVAVDCANGATYQTASRILQMLGADVQVLSDKPDGVNINHGCGSTHMDTLLTLVQENSFDIGLAFDGDGDRCLAVDENGKMVDGDQIMAILGRFMKSQGTLQKDTIVATVMSNLGLTLMGQENELNIVQTKVGDRYVLETMLEEGYNLGGEQSGHIILLDKNTTGDGVLTGITLLYVMSKTGKKLSELASCMTPLPQVLVGAKVAPNRKEDYKKDPGIVSEIALLEAKLNGKGRVLIRPSGTEPLVRVMIEGQNIDEITADAKRIAKMIEDMLQ